MTNTKRICISNVHEHHVNMTLKRQEWVDYTQLWWIANQDKHAHGDDQLWINCYGTFLSGMANSFPAAIMPKPKSRQAPMQTRARSAKKMPQAADAPHVASVFAAPQQSKEIPFDQVYSMWSQTWQGNLCMQNFFPHLIACNCMAQSKWMTRSIKTN